MLPQTKPSIAIVKSKNTRGKDPTFSIKSVLNKAGYTASVWDDVGGAQEALRSQTHDLVFVVDEILPDGVGDTFIQWLNALPMPPEVLIVLSVKGTNLWPSTKDDISNEVLYDLCDKGYIPTMTIDAENLSTDLLPVVKRMFPLGT